MDLSSCPQSSLTESQALRDCLSLLASQRLSQPSQSKLLDQVELRLLWLLRRLGPLDYLISHRLRSQYLQMRLSQSPNPSH